MTRNAWGYRLMSRLEYPDVLGTGITVYPSVFFSHDVKGYSADGAFLEDRKALNIGVRFSYQRRYALDINYTTYGDSARFDPLRDRDYYSINGSINF